MTAKDKITKARASLILDHPFFGTLALRLTVKGDKSLPTAGTDGQSLLYNPKFIEALELDYVKAIVAHEVMHLVCLNHVRRQNRDMFKWNVATDYANNLLLEKTFNLPQGVLLDHEFDNMYAEEIYNKLPNIPKDFTCLGTVQDASGQNGQTLSQSERDQIAQDWKIAIAQAAQVAKNQGNLPAGLERFVDSIVNPKLDWRVILRRFVEQTSRNDYAWSPPSRRHIHNGLYLPSLRSLQYKPLTIAIDTSGSISGEQLSQFQAEISSISEETKAEIRVFYCDAAVAGEEIFTDGEFVVFHPKGGGGTDFRPVFEKIDTDGLDVACLIYLTDLEGTFPDVGPEYPVLWIVANNEEKVAPFGETICL